MNLKSRQPRVIPARQSKGGPKWCDRSMAPLAACVWVTLGGLYAKSNLLSAHNVNLRVVFLYRGKGVDRLPAWGFLFATEVCSLINVSVLSHRSFSTTIVQRQKTFQVHYEQTKSISPTTHNFSVGMTFLAALTKLKWFVFVFRSLELFKLWVDIPTRSSV